MRKPGLAILLATKGPSSPNGDSSRSKEAKKRGDSSLANKILKSPEWGDSSTQDKSLDYDEDEEMEGDTDTDNPVDLFIEAIGGTPSKEARKAFKLAVQSCGHDLAEDEEMDFGED